MKKIFRSIIISFTFLFTVVLFTFAFAGCSTIEDQMDEEPVTAVVLVIGNHKNSFSLNFNDQKIKDVLLKAFSRGLIAVVSCDGAPELIFAENFEVAEQYRSNPELLHDIAMEKTSKLLMGLADVRANDPEVDMLESLRLATRILADAPEGAEKIILVWDTGLSTAGMVNFCNNIIGADSDTIASLLGESQAIPDFTGVTVKWRQMGDVALPQPKIPPPQVAALKSIWEKIVEKTGGSFESLETVPNPGNGGSDLPPVSIVELLPEEPIRFETAATINFDKPQILSEEQVRFIPDSNEYLNPEDALAAITPIAEYMISTPGFNMLLIGTTAGDDDNEYCLNLSQNRANMVKSTLVALGVPADRITTLGLGNGDPWHISDAGYDGPLAAANRKVILISADSPEAAILLGSE